MSSDLEQFKIKITAYSVEQLEEVLISLNKDKFPEKYQLVRETLANKKGGSASLPSDNFQATVVDTARAIGLQIPLSETPSVPAAVEIPAVPIPPASVPEAPKPAEPLKVPEPIPLAPKVPAASPASFSAVSSSPSPTTSSLPMSFPKSEAAPVSPEKTGGALQGFFLLFVLLTGLIAAYCLLLPTMDLPGKAQVLDLARKLPDLPAFKNNDLQQIKNGGAESNEGAESKDTSVQKPAPKKPEAPKKK